jgi:hypothetical protein
MEVISSLTPNCHRWRKAAEALSQALSMRDRIAAPSSAIQRHPAPFAVAATQKGLKNTAAARKVFQAPEKDFACGVCPILLR